MKNREAQKREKPTAEQMRGELKRIRYQHTYWRTLCGTMVSLLLAAALVMSAVLLLPVLRITSDSMSPTMNRGDIVVTLRGDEMKRGDLVVFYTEGNKLLLKRVAALSGDVVHMDEDGTLSVNGEMQAESYVSHKALGECDLEFPYTVPNGSIFVLGDNRELSLDSRSSVIGCVKQEQIIGRAAARIWPLESFEVLMND